ncbi:cadherin-like domain-containing protein [bacterium]|nr:cadherin-like domain-containing protein [bacterium]
MKKILFVFWWLCTGWLAGQNINRAEYFIDSDPGFGNGTPITVAAPGASVTLNFSVPLATISDGFHSLYVRTRDNNSLWSITNAYPFFKTYGAGPALQNIVKMEYFFDNDPGFGAGTNVVVNPIGSDITESFSINTDALSSGFHTLYVRVQDSKGLWTVLNANPFFKTFSAPSGLPNIVQLEYFIDNDPGLGLGTQLTITPGTDITKNFTVDIGSVPSGFHTLYLRAKDANGKWTVLNANPFFKTFSAPSGLPNIVQLEYFIDNDPGLGLGTQLTITPGTDITKNFTVDIGSVPSGFHTLYLRAKDANGKWTVLNANPFFKTFSAPSGLPNIVQLEYFIDNDPGLGAGSQLSISAGTDITKNFTVDIGSVPSGFHTLYFRAKDANEKWSILNANSFFKTYAAPQAVVPVASLEYYFHKSGVNTATLSYSGFASGSNVNVSFDPDLSSLQKDSTYRMFIYAKDFTGLRSLAMIDTFIAPDVPPAAPKDLIALSGNGQASLSWKKNTEPDFLKYYIYQGTSPNPTLLVDSTSGINDTSKVISPLNNGTTYFFRVAAADTVHQLSAYSNEVAVTPGDITAPNAPVLISVVAGDSLVTVSWMENSEPDILRYRIFSGTSVNPTIQIDSTTTGDTTKTFFSLNAGTTYYFRIVAVDNAFNASGFSNELSATPTSPTNQLPMLELAYSDFSVTINHPDTTLDSIAAHFSDADDSNLEFSVGTSNPGKITPFVIGGRLKLSFITGQTGVVSIYVTATDDSNAAVSDTFNITIDAVNAQPIAANDNATTTFQTAVTIHVLNNDIDPDGNTLTIQSVSNGTNGSTVKNSGDTTITYTPNNGFSGNDQFTYIVTDGNGGLDTASVSVTVSAPIALTLTTSVLQNPALSKYADIYVVGDTTLQSVPVVRRIIGGDSASVIMSGSGSIYHGTIEFTQNGAYTIRTHATSVTGSAVVQIRSFNVTLAKPSLTAQLKSLSEQSVLTIPKLSLKNETYFTAFEKEQAGETIVEFGPSGSWAQPLELTMTYEPSAWKNPGKLFIYHYTVDGWKPLRTQVFQNERQAKAFVTELGLFKLMENEQFEGTNVVPSAFSLNQNYPNPFNPTTTIVYDLAKDETVELSVYNMLGQKVKTLTNGFQLAGQYRVLWDGTNLNGQSAASGVYFYRIKSSSFVKTKKMLLIR